MKIINEENMKRMIEKGIQWIKFNDFFIEDLNLNFNIQIFLIQIFGSAKLKQKI